MRSTTLDPESKKVLAHLQERLTDGSSLDLALVENYIDHIKFNPHLVSNGGNVLDLPVLVAFVPLLERLLRATGEACYEDLLLALLQPLPLQDIFKFFPRDQIDAAPHGLPMELAIATRVIHSACKRRSADAEHFVRTLAFMPAAVQCMLRDPAVPWETVSQLERLMQVAAHPPEFQWDRWRFLLDRDPLQVDAMAAARHVAVVRCLVACCGLIPLPDFTALCAFDIDSLFSADVDNPETPDNIDCLFPPVAIDSYCFLAGQVPFECIQAPVDSCMSHLAARRSRGFDNLSLDPPLNRLLCTLSHHKDTKCYARAYLDRYPELCNYDLYKSGQVEAFVKFSLDVIPDKSTFFAHHFGQWKRLETVPSRLLPAVLWLISDPDFFVFFKNAWLSDEMVNNLPLPAVYELLYRLAQHDYSAEVMIAALPRAVDAHLASFNRSFSNPELWELRKTALRLLLFEREVDLGHWRKPMSDTYLEIVNGRKLRAREPQVAVESNFA